LKADIDDPNSEDWQPWYIPIFVKDGQGDDSEHCSFWLTTAEPVDFTIAEDDFTANMNQFCKLVTANIMKIFGQNIVLIDLIFGSSSLCSDQV